MKHQRHTNIDDERIKQQHNIKEKTKNETKMNVTKPIRNGANKNQTKFINVPKNLLRFYTSR